MRCFPAPRGFPALRDHLAAIDDAVVTMERAGVRLDAGYCESAARVAARDEREALARLRRWADAVGWPETYAPDMRSRVDGTWSSNLRLPVFLHSPLGANLECSPVWDKGEVADRTVDGASTDRAALRWLRDRAHERGDELNRDGLDALMDLRRVRSGRKYLEKFPRFAGADGLIHPVFGPAGDQDDRVGAVSGRLACKIPELHQVPRDPEKDRYRVRRAIVAGPGEALVVVDASALEVVILASLCSILFGDTQLPGMVAPGAPDVHSTNARRIFGDLLGWEIPAEHPPAPCGSRRVADIPVEVFKRHPHGKWLRDTIKRVWYGLQYGKGDHGFGATLLDARGNPIGVKRAHEIREGLLDAVPAIRRYQDWVRWWIGRHGGMPSLLGRWCDLRDLMAGPEWARARAWRRALNYPMQAGAADVINTAMVLVANHPRIRALGWVLILQVHDELVLRGPAESADEVLDVVKGVMVSCFPLPGVQLGCSGGISTNWEEGKA